MPPFNQLASSVTNASTICYPPSFTGYHPPYASPTIYPPSPLNDYLYPPSSTIYPSSDLQFKNYVESRLNKIEHQLTLLEERITQAEGSTVTVQTTTSSSSIPGISMEKLSAINMILTNKVMGWKAALRKILVVVFGVDTLSQFCAKGKKTQRPNH